MALIATTATAVAIRASVALIQDSTYTPDVDMRAFPRTDIAKLEKGSLMFDANHPSQLLPGTQLSLDLPLQDQERQPTEADQFARRLQGLKLLRELTLALGEQRAAIDLADFRRRLVSDR